MYIVLLFLNLYCFPNEAVASLAAGTGSLWAAWKPRDAPTLVAAPAYSSSSEQAWPRSAGERLAVWACAAAACLGVGVVVGHVLRGVKVS